MKTVKFFHSILLMAIFLVLAGCGGGGGDKPEDQNYQAQFGDVLVAAMKEHAIQMMSIGEKGMNVNVLPKLPPPFSIVQDNCSSRTVPSGSSCTFTILFAPTAAGSFSHSFDFPSDAANKTTVNMSGRGITSTALPPAAPTGVSATPGNGQVTIIWNTVSGASAYTLYWRTGSGAESQITNVTSPYVHTGRTNSTQYHYAVTARNAGGESSRSTEVSATPAAGSAPTGTQAHISYYDAINGDLKYATNASGAWVATTANSTGDVGWFSSLALDAAGKVHISHYDDIDATNGDLKYTTNASGAWITTTVDSAGDVGGFSSLALDAAGKAHISYYDATSGDLKYATNASGTWVATTLDSTGDVGRFSSLALDAAGKAHISYHDFTNGNLKYATNTSGAWVYKAANALANTGWGSSLALDAAGKVHISYSSDSGFIWYTTNTSGAWDYKIPGNIGKAGLTALSPEVFTSLKVR